MGLCLTMLFITSLLAFAPPPSEAEGCEFESLGGEFIEPICMERKYLVAACRSCSRSSAVCLLKQLN